MSNGTTLATAADFGPPPTSSRLFKCSCVILDWAARGTQQWFQESNYLSARTRRQLQPPFIIEVNLPRQTKVHL